jgi:hypothetical protein
MQRFAALAVGAALIVAADAEARGGGGGGGRGGRGRAGFREEAPPFRWFDSREQAFAAAAGVEPGLPVMCFLRRANGSADRQYAHAIFGRMDTATASRREFAAFRVDNRTDEGKELAKRHKIRRDGGLLWFDSHGNFVSRVDQVLKVSHVITTVRQWDAVLKKFEHEVGKRVREARGHAERGRYTSALKALEPIIDLKGPPGDEMCEVLAAVEKRGNALLDRVDMLTHGRTGRRSLLAAVAAEFRGCSVETRAREIAGAPGETPPPAVPAARTSVPRAPEMPDPSIEMMLREVDEAAPAAKGAAKSAPAPEATSAADSRGPDELLAASRERLREGAGLLKGDDDVGAFMALTEALDLAALALEKKPGHVATRRFVESVAAERYECYMSLVE